MPDSDDDFVDTVPRPKPSEVSLDNDDDDAEVPKKKKKIHIFRPDVVTVKSKADCDNYRSRKRSLQDGAYTLSKNNKTSVTLIVASKKFSKETDISGLGFTLDQLTGTAITGCNFVPEKKDAKKSKADVVQEYFKDKVDRYIERLYKFAATYNVSATVVIAQPGSSELIIAGVGYTLVKLKRRRQLYTFRFTPPNTNGKYIVNMDVSKNLAMSESITDPTILHSEKSKKSKKPSPETKEVDDLEDREVIEVPEMPEESDDTGAETNDADSGPGDKSKDVVKEVVAGPSNGVDVTEEVRMRMEAAMDTSCSSETVGLTKKPKLSLGRGAKKKGNFERKMPIASSIYHKQPLKFTPPPSKHQI